MTYTTLNIKFQKRKRNNSFSGSIKSFLPSQSYAFTVHKLSMKTCGHSVQFSFPKRNLARSWVLFQTYCQMLRDKQPQKQHWELKALRDNFYFPTTSGLLHLWSWPLLVQFPLILILILTCFSQKTLFYPKLSHINLSIIFLTITTSQLGVMCKFT